MQYPRRKSDLVLEAFSERNSEHEGGVGVGGGGGGGREDLELSELMVVEASAQTVCTRRAQGFRCSLV